MINQNETVQRVSAAVEAGTMPDVLDVSLDLLSTLSAQDVFMPLDDLYASIGAAQGGWFPSVDSASDTTAIAGGRTGIPFGVSGNLILRRTDLLEPAGFTEAPATWDELVDAGRGGQRAAGLRPRPRALQRRRRQHAGRGHAVLSADASPTTPARPSPSSPTPRAPISRGSRTPGTAASSRRATPPGTARATTRPICPGRRRSSPTPARSASPPRTRTPSSSRRPTTRRCRRARRA